MKMKGKARWTALLLGLPLLLLYHHLLRYIHKAWTNNLKHPSYKWRNELPRGLDSSYTSSMQHRKSETFDARNCRMETCFDFSKCARGFKIYVYPEGLGGQPSPSERYGKVNDQN